MKKIASTNANAKLSVDEIYEIIRLHKLGKNLREQAKGYNYINLSKRFGITRMQIYRLLHGHSYKHIQRPE